MHTNTATRPWRIVLAEDETLLRHVLAKSLGRDERFEFLGDFPNGLEARDACFRLMPDLLVTDLEMPLMNGFELAAQLRTKVPCPRLLALSHLGDPRSLSRIIEAGFHGYVAKDDPLEVLEEAMVEVASGGTYFPAAIVQGLASLRSNPDSFAALLTPREQEVLVLVASGETSRAIAGQLGLSPRSVETYRYRIMQKLGVENIAGLVEYAMAQGLIRPRGIA